MGLLLLLPAACAAPEQRASEALQDALSAGRASIAAAAPVVGPQAVPARLAAAPPRRGGTLAPRTAGQLLGAGPAALERWLGAPSLRRVEGMAEVWLYLAPGCALDLVLYRERGGIAVAHAAARAQDAATVTEADCLAAIAGAPAPAAAGLPARPDDG